MEAACRRFPRIARSGQSVQDVGRPGSLLRRPVVEVNRLGNSGTVSKFGTETDFRGRYRLRFSKSTACGPGNPSPSRICSLSPNFLLTPERSCSLTSPGGIYNG